MSRWDGIVEFVQVVESSSFSRAAEALSMSTSQVSKLVARLEERLGLRLLNRTTRRLTLTDEGEHFYQHCRQTIDQFDEAEKQVTLGQNEPRGKLRVNIAGSFQERFLVPMLCNFQKLHPRLQVEVVFTDQRVDLISGSYDLAICPGELPDSSMVARKLADNYLYLVAHPDYLAAHGTPQSIEDLKQHNCLAGSDKTWYFGNGQETLQITPQGNWHSDNGNALLSAARSGAGLALLPFFAVLDDIKQGTLVQVLPQWSQHPQPVWVMYPEKRYVAARVRLFIDYLIEHIQQIRL
jgi:DNA-binding transcriptional LysR family regulator